MFIYYFSRKAYKEDAVYMNVKPRPMPITHKTCHVCDVTIHRASMAKHLRSKNHLIRLGILPNETKCYIKLKKICKSPSYAA